MHIKNLIFYQLVVVFISINTYIMSFPLKGKLDHSPQPALLMCLEVYLYFSVSSITLLSKELWQLEGIGRNPFKTVLKVYYS